MMTTRLAQEQIARLKVQKTWGGIEASAAKHHLPLAFVCAICSRETNCDNKLGDFRGNLYHGVGVMQIDIQHAIAREAIVDGTWKLHPEPLIEFGCGLLDDTLVRIKSHTLGLTGWDYLKFTASAYNAGWGGAMRGHDEGDCDKFTTGHNYGHDVMERMVCFEAAIEKGPRPPRKVVCK